MIPNLKLLATHAALEVVDEVMDEALAKAQEMSSGPYSQAQLDAMGNPFSAASPQDFPPAEIINKQSGNFFEAWKKRPTLALGDEIFGEVDNYDPVADFLEFGTSKMVERPIAQELQAFVDAQIEARLLAKVEEAFDFVVEVA